MADRAGDPEPSPQPDKANVADALIDLIRAGPVKELEELPSTAELARRDREQDIKLKRRYANWLLAMMAGQLVAANGVFIVYAWAGVEWKIESGVIQVWLAATVVQVIGVVLVVVRYLFPRRDMLP